MHKLYLIALTLCFQAKHYRELSKKLEADLKRSTLQLAQHEAEHRKVQVRTQTSRVLAVLRSLSLPAQRHRFSQPICHAIVVSLTRSEGMERTAHTSCPASHPDNMQNLARNGKGQGQ